MRPTPQQIAAAARDCSWQYLSIIDALGHHAHIAVTSDAVMVDGVRVTVTHREAEIVARTVGHHLFTPLVADQLYAQAAVVIAPRTQLPCRSDEAAVLRHSQACDAAIAGRQGLVANTGKHWVNCRAAHQNKMRGYNYGWNGKGLPYRAATAAGDRVWQPLASAHNLEHHDYSQTLRLMHGACTVDGTARRTAEVARSPELWRLVSHEGPLELHHPGVDGPDPAASPDAPTEPPPPTARWWVDGPHAANYYPASERRGVDLIVIHSSEAAEKPYTAESLAAWSAGKCGPAPSASWHWAVDNDSAVRCCPEGLVAWHANGANRWAIGIEHAGYARQTEAEWRDPYSEAMLLLSARVVRELLAPRYHIPVRRPSIDTLRQALYEVRAGRPYPEQARGLCAHSDLVRAGWGGCHGDPGPGFPWAWYLAECSRG